LTDHGRALARLWSETDLLTAECLRHGVWDGLVPAELAAVISVLVYEARGNTVTPRVPPGAVSDALVATVRLWAELEADERRHRLERTREPDLGFAWPVYRWARGESLSAVLLAAENNGAELSAGDFVRWCRQVVDILDQVRGVAGEATAIGTAAAAAVRALRRGVVGLGT
ncbi:MAG: DEAD/DEAH box helicase, partial [Pseudonocardiaceae bacterium]